VLVALGMLAADIIKDYVRTIMISAEEAQESVEKVLSELEAQGQADLALEGFSSEQVTIEKALDLRYVGQSYELIVPFASEVAEAVTAFHAAHERRFGYNNPQERVQVVNVRLKARGITTHPPARFSKERKNERGAAIHQTLRRGVTSRVLSLTARVGLLPRQLISRFTSAQCLTQSRRRSTPSINSRLATSLRSTILS